MGRVRAARRIATAAAVGGGGIGVLTGAMVGVLFAEARYARRVVGVTDGQPPTADGRYGDDDDTPPIRLAMLGDSTAAGLGVRVAAETPAALIAVGLAKTAGRPVQLANVARSGAQARDLDAQVTRALAARPDIALIMIGANDVTHRENQAAAVRHLMLAVRRLRAAGAEVVVGTCPDLGTIEPIAQPLRYLTRRWSRQLAAAQTIAVVAAGGRTVSLATLLGPEFAQRPDVLFGPDRFHPSAQGYAAAATAVLPSVCAALGLAPPPEAAGHEGWGVLPVAHAAVAAAARGGVEVAATPAPTGRRGPRGRGGRWARLRLRPRWPLSPDRSAIPASNVDR